ncbi:hypothetical protein GDO86_017678, partial [Hymenochirus boettgeri]
MGLSLASDGSNGQLLACGPTMQRVCGKNIYVNGHCYQLDTQLRLQETLPPSLPECSGPPLDIVFLIDGSGSIRKGEFTIVLDFVSKVIEQFSTSNALFAFMQYSSKFEIHFDFNDFSKTSDRNSLIQNIIQQRGNTYTATAILRVLEDLFIDSSGSRPRSQKILIVVTDGQKNDALPYDEPIAKAESLGILRFAIGVGKAFTTAEALEELNSIASEPTTDHVFRVGNFAALSQLQEQLQNKIFAIEGTQAQTGTAFEMEMSQDGFSSILTPEGAMLGAVGAFDWSGGVSIYKNGEKEGIWINATQDQIDTKAAYLGYALQQLAKNVIAVGAPRSQHIGSVVIFKRDPSTSNWNLKCVINGKQIGSYFGSVLSGGSINSDSSQLLLLVGAPTYYAPDSPGGRVYLCPINSKKMKPSTPILALGSDLCPKVLQGAPSQYLGHFGSAISILPDLTGDRLDDLAVGAPYEDQNQGAIYIFAGEKEGFRTSYVQRIAGNHIAMGLMFFGRSLSGNLDMTRDGLPDLTIGSEGKVTILRSRSVLGVSISMTVRPSTIPLTFFECPNPTDKGAATTLTVCVNTAKRSLGDTGAVTSRLRYTIQLDAGRSQTRVLFDNTERSKSKILQLREGAVCENEIFRLPECVEDSLSPVRIALNYTLSGGSVLSEDSPTNYSYQVPFQKNCGSDNICQDYLRINTSFANLKSLVLGVTTEVNVTVSVQNQGEDSFNSRAVISHPIGLSYRRAVVIQSSRRLSVSCSVLDGETVNCGINNPLLRPNSSVVFVVIFSLPSGVNLRNPLRVSANVTSDNGGAFNNLMRSLAQLKVLYGVYVTVTSLEDSTKYTNFSSESESSDMRIVQHVYRV